MVEAAERSLREYRLQLRELRDEEPDSSRIPRIERELQNLEHLRAFALPLVETMSSWPDVARWGDWMRAPRGVRAPRPEAARRCPPCARRSSADEHRRARSADRSPRCAVRPSAFARSGSAGESLWACLCRQPAPGARPGLQSRVRPGAGRAPVSAEAARRSAAARRVAQVRSHRSSDQAVRSRRPRASLVAPCRGGRGRASVRFVPAHRNRRGTVAGALLLCARNHACGHRPGARSPDARADCRGGVEREPGLARPEGRNRCHRRPRARPVGASPADDEQ